MSRPPPHPPGPGIPPYMPSHAPYPTPRPQHQANPPPIPLATHRPPPPPPLPSAQPLEPSSQAHHATQRHSQHHQTHAAHVSDSKHTTQTIPLHTQTSAPKQTSAPSHSHPHSHPHSHSHSHPHPHSHSHSRPHSHPHPHSHPNPQANSHSSASAQPQPSAAARASVAAISSNASQEMRQNYQVKLRYRNRLPEPPVDCKLMAYPFDPNRHVRYFVSIMEREYVSPVLVEPLLGIHVEAINRDIYLEKSKNDLSDTDSIFSLTPIKESNETSSKGWLHQQTYYQPFQEPAASKKQQPTEEAKSSHVKIETPEDIRKSFEDAQKPPVHPTNPSMEVAKVIPVFPDFDRFPNSYSYAYFTQAPVLDREISSTVESDTSRKVNQAIMVVLSASSKSMTYMLPEKLVEPESDRKEPVRYIGHSDFKYEKDTDSQAQTHLVLVHDEKRNTTLYNNINKIIVKKQISKPQLASTSRKRGLEKADLETVEMTESTKRYHMENIRNSIYYNIDIPQHILRELQVKNDDRDSSDRESSELNEDD